MSVLETERLVVRRLELDDAAFILGLLNEPSFLRYIGDRGVRSLDDARRYIEQGPLASYERFGFGLFLVALRKSGESIGICGLLKRDTLDDVDVGFAFLPDHWRQGYAYESASAVMEWGMRTRGIERIVAVTQSDNFASIRTLEKLGLRFKRMVRLHENEPEIQLFA